MNFYMWIDYLRELNMLSMFLRLLIAALCGGIIGISRGRRQHAAGMRTHLLVCIGSASVMLTSQFVTMELGYGGDMLRMPAQVVSGIGFLGAGSIIVTGKRHVSGLTTAAGLWSSSCMGLAAGAGYYECAILLCVFIYIVLVTLDRIDTSRVKRSRNMTVYLELASDTPLGAVLADMKSYARFVGLEAYGSCGEGCKAYALELELLGNIEHAEVVTETCMIVGVNFCEEMKS